MFSKIIITFLLISGISLLVLELAFDLTYFMFQAGAGFALIVLASYIFSHQLLKRKTKLSKDDFGPFPGGGGPFNG